MASQTPNPGSSPALLEDGKYGRRAVLRAGWCDELIGYFARNRIVELELNQAKGWRGDELSFLAALPGLMSLEILDFNIRDVKPIHLLRKLKRLGVTTYCSTEIDFSVFSELESCSLEWRARSESLFGCTTLRELFVNRYPGRDVAPFANLVNLESLAILNAPVQDLHGLAALTRLRSLRLAVLKLLSSLAGIESLEGLEELEVHTCRAIRSIGETSSLVGLKRLYLNNDGDIESLKPLESLGGLEAVVFYESTNILDGDLSPLLRQRNLSRVSFQNRRHYSHRREDFGTAHGR
jgi:hypothetical protein